jgi:hypothetical protein
MNWKVSYLKYRRCHEFHLEVIKEGGRIVQLRDRSFFVWVIFHFLRPDFWFRRAKEKIWILLFEKDLKGRNKAVLRLQEANKRYWANNRWDVESYIFYNIASRKRV